VFERTIAKDVEPYLEEKGNVKGQRRMRATARSQRSEVFDDDGWNARLVPWERGRPRPHWFGNAFDA
jgi:hypothetical protein